MRLSDLQGKRVLLWGAGRETTSLVRNLRRNGVDLDLLATVVDQPTGTPAERELAVHAPVLTPKAARPQLNTADVVVRSPVIRPSRRELREVRSRGATLTTATALWLAEHEGVHAIGVTGSKGKTTTTTLIGHLLRTEGLNIEIAGNIGRPVTDIDPTDDLDHVVLELSSFQLVETTRAPQIAVYTNFLREHDNWHRGTDHYLAAKLNMCRAPGVEHVVARAGDFANASQALGIPTHAYGETGDYVVDGDLIRFAGAEILTLSDLPLRGRHNLLNVAAALTAVAMAARPIARPREVLEDFVPPPNRLERVTEHDGVTWVDDDHSSTPESTIAAARAFDGAILLIVGGRLRGQDHSQLLEEVRFRSELQLVLFESGGAKIHADALEAGLDPAQIHFRESLRDAFDCAAREALTGATVILSPIGLMEDAAVPILARSQEFRAYVAAISEVTKSRTAIVA